MSDDLERLEAERLRNRINSVINAINRTNSDNTRLEAELRNALHQMQSLIQNCERLDRAVYGQMNVLSQSVETADISTKEVFGALHELSLHYFTFKNISTASKNMTQMNDFYFTKYGYYNELRRITLGYVIGLDNAIISSDTLRKKVEKAYLQNTDYWLAYSIAAVMLWASDEEEAAQRALNKSLSINYFNACLFYLLINLRFNRVDAAKKWYVNYLDRADMYDLGEEWRYLLQAYLFGAFGADEAFQEQVAGCLKNMLNQAEATTVGFTHKFTDQAQQFAELYLHKTEHEFAVLKRTCSEYDELKGLLSTGEKNAEIAKYYNKIAEADTIEGDDLAQRIENVLYALINNYDDEEHEVVKEIKFNEAIISAQGDIAAAQAKYHSLFPAERHKKTFGDLMLLWAFSEDSHQTDLSVKRFALSLTKEAIAKGLEQFVEQYRKEERDKYTITIDEHPIVCDENDFAAVKPQLERYYDKSKLKNTFKDKHVLIYTGLCGLSLALLALAALFFHPVILTLGILVGLGGSFLLWRRLVDMKKILQEKKRKGVLLLNQALQELKRWRALYKEEDAKSDDMLQAIGRF